MEDAFSPYASTDGVKRGQHLLQAFFGGLIAAIFGAILWMFIPALIKVDVGDVALGMGILVGMMVRFAGSGSNFVFGLVGVVMTLAGSMLGEVLAAIKLSTDSHNDFLAAFKHLDLSQLITSLVVNASPTVYGLYAAGIAVSYFLSMRR